MLFKGADSVPHGAVLPESFLWYRSVGSGEGPNQEKETKLELKVFEKAAGSLS